MVYPKSHECQEETDLTETWFEQYVDKFKQKKILKDFSGGAKAMIQNTHSHPRDDFGMQKFPVIA